MPVRYPQLHDPDWLEREYVTRRRSTYDIASELGCAPKSVARAVQDAGLPVRDRATAARLSAAERRPEQLDDRDWLDDHYTRQRLSCPQIATALNISTHSVRQALVRHGIERRHRGERYPELNDETWLHRHLIIERMTLTEVAEKVGSTAGAVRLAADRHGLVYDHMNERWSTPFLLDD